MEPTRWAGGSERGAGGGTTMCIAVGAVVLLLLLSSCDGVVEVGAAAAEVGVGAAVGVVGPSPAAAVDVSIVVVAGGVGAEAVFASAVWLTRVAAEGVVTVVDWVVNFTSLSTTPAEHATSSMPPPDPATACIAACIASATTGTILVQYWFNALMLSMAQTWF